MRRILKYAGILAGAVVLLACAGVAGLYAWTSNELATKSPLPGHAFTAPTDSASVARGEHVVRAIGKCGDCHGQDLGGDTLLNDPAMGLIYSPNLTRGAGGIGGTYTDAQWEAAIRHGLAADGRRLVVMPSNEYQFLSDEDLGTIIAYLRSVPAVDRTGPAQRVGPLARALYAGGVFPMFPAKAVTHGDEVVPSVAIDSTAAYGKYLGDVGCSGCHGVTYGGGAIPGGPPDWPKPANLTPTGIGHYTQEGFVSALRTGKRPDGTEINPFMPIAATRQMTDVEIVAVYKYLRTLPARPFGSR
jgi:mono/diheme cytochrome c family protein